MNAQAGSFEAVRNRLDEIVEAVNAEGVSLDEALALYEEAVKLGLSACDLSEQEALEAYAADQAAFSSEPDAAAAVSGEGAIESTEEAAASESAASSDQDNGAQ